MENSCFAYNGKLYYAGTIIELKEEQKASFRFNSNLVFRKYDSNSGVYHFSALYDGWEVFQIPADKLPAYIEAVLVEKQAPPNSNKKQDPKHIDGIMSAWIWYILLMFFSLFLKGAGNIILAWIVISFIFFRWRHNKINGK